MLCALNCCTNESDNSCIFLSSLSEGIAVSHLTTRGYTFQNQTTSHLIWTGISTCYVLLLDRTQPSDDGPPITGTCLSLAIITLDMLFFSTFSTEDA